jgi:hypothetical protein
VARLEPNLSRRREGRVKGLVMSIDPGKPPKNFKDVMSREDMQEWAEAYDNEYQGFYDHGTLKIARPEPGAKVLGTPARSEYKLVNGVFEKRIFRLCVMGNQHHGPAGRAFGPSAIQDVPRFCEAWEQPKTNN